MIAAIVLGWILVAFGLLTVQVDAIRSDPSEMPGGGPWAVVARSFLWPLIVALAAVVLVVMGVEALLGGPRR